MGEQRLAAGVVECSEPIPKRVIVGRNIRFPSLMPLVDGLRIWSIGEILALFTEEDMTDRGLNARSTGGGSMERVAHQLVQQGRERDMRIGTDRIAER